MTQKIEMAEWRKDTYIIPGKRKTGLLLGDDFRMPSGIGTQSKEIVLNTIQHFNWVQVGASINHPDLGKIIDMKEAVKNETGIEDAYCRIYCNNGYGDADLIRYLLKQERIDFILHFTDPRYYIWLYQIEREIRQRVPILYYTIWDDLPAPLYNFPYYASCDGLFAISKQTYNICKHVLSPKNVKIGDSVNE